MQILSYVLSILGMISMISASLIKGKNMKAILFLVCCANFLVATGYLLGGSGINGAASCFLGGIQSIVNYFFESKEKPLPRWLIAIYAVSFVAVNIAVGGFAPIVIFAIVACLSFIMGIVQKNGAKYRFWIIVNTCLWILYDIVSKSYGALTSHIPLLIFTVAGMIIHDRKQKANQE